MNLRLVANAFGWAGATCTQGILGLSAVLCLINGIGGAAESVYRVALGKPFAPDPLDRVIKVFLPESMHEPTSTGWKIGKILAPTVIAVLAGTVFGTGMRFAHMRAMNFRACIFKKGGHI